VNLDEVVCEMVQSSRSRMIVQLPRKAVREWLAIESSPLPEFRRSLQGLQVAISALGRRHGPSSIIDSENACGTEVDLYAEIDSA
jgi:hypothetical protein